MPNIVIYVWSGASGTYNEAVISTTRREFAEEFKAWAEEQGYRVTVSDGFEQGRAEH